MPCTSFCIDKISADEQGWFGSGGDHTTARGAFSGAGNVVIVAGRGSRPGDGEAVARPSDDGNVLTVKAWRAGIEERGRRDGGRTRRQGVPAILMRRNGYGPAGVFGRRSCVNRGEGGLELRRLLGVVFL